MYSSMTKLINGSDSRHLDAKERERLLAYARSLPARVQATRQLERLEGEIARRTIDALRRRYPRLEQYHENNWEKGARDLRMTLRANAQALLMDDLRVAEEKGLRLMRNVMENAGFTPKFNREVMTQLAQSCRELSPREVFALLEPHLDRNIEILGGVPEPALAG